MIADPATRPTLGWTHGLAAATLALWPAAPALVQAFHGMPDPETGMLALLGRLFPLTAYAAGLAMLLALTGHTRRALPLLVPAALFTLPELFYVNSFGLPSGAHVYGILAETHDAEVLSWIGPWWLPALVLWAGLAALVAWSAWQWWRADWRWVHRSRAWVLAACAVLTAGGLVDHQVRPDPTVPVPAGSIQVYWADLGLEPRLEAAYPWGMPWRIQRYRAELQTLRQRRLSLRATPFVLTSAPSATANDNREVHVLVIGESSRADHWGLFGAPRNTTPLLAKRPGLIVFRDAVSAASGTRESVPLMLTRRAPDAVLASTAEPSVLSAFRQAGYRSHWLTMQAFVGEHDTPVSAIAHEADESHFLNVGDYRGSGALDGALLPALQRALDQAAPRQFIVLHMLGSHLNYAHRYPPAFAVFQPALKASEHPDIWSPSQGAVLVNAYDNSIAYSDWVLDQAIAALERSGAVATLTFAADHGEALFDGRCGRAGHGFAAVSNYHVPMFMWLSAAWREGHAQEAGRLAARQSDPISTLALFPTLMGLGGFGVALPSAYPDLAGPLPQPTRRQVLHFGDFDRGVLAQACDVPARTNDIVQKPG